MEHLSLALGMSHAAILSTHNDGSMSLTLVGGQMSFYLAQSQIVELVNFLATALPATPEA